MGYIMYTTDFVSGTLVIRHFHSKRMFTCTKELERKGIGCDGWCAVRDHRTDSLKVRISYGATLKNYAAWQHYHIIA